MVRLGTEEAAQELLERRLRRVAFALHRREAVAVRAAVLDPFVEEAGQAQVLSLFEGFNLCGNQNFTARLNRRVDLHATGPATVQMTMR